MDNLTELAGKLASLCRRLKFVEAYQELFAGDAISIDPIYKNEPLQGLAALIDREQQFLSANVVHSCRISEPLFAANYFSVVIALEFVNPAGEHKAVKEIAVYKVEQGKITSQQFFI